MIDDELTPKAAATDETVPAESGVATSEQPEVAAVTTAVADKPADTDKKTEDELLFEAALASMEGEESRRETSGGIAKGERIEAKVIQVERDRVFVDLGTKAEGVVPLSELSEEALESAVGHVKPGDTFEVIVLRTTTEGNPVVSKRRADFDVTWKKILDAFEIGTMFQAQVVDRVKGGLVVDIGVRGFVPATHVGTGKLRNIEKYVGEILPVKIIEVDRERRKVVLSNRSAESERREEVKKEIFDKVAPGDILPGVVRRLTDYGAFVDLGGIDGLLHISEMSWIRIDHPKEVLSEGDEINVMILRLDAANGRVSLGLRQVLPDPWNLVKQNYRVGQKIKCNVTRLVQSGAFVKLPEGAEAFLPLSEISNRRIKKPNEAINEGDEIEPTIIDLRADDRRMVLSLRDGSSMGAEFASGYSYRDREREGAMAAGDKKHKRGGKKRGDSPEPEQQGARGAAGGATIGERLGMLKGFLRSDGDEGAETPAEPAAKASAEPVETPVAEPEPVEAPAPEPEPAAEPTPEPEPEA